MGNLRVTSNRNHLVTSYRDFPHRVQGRTAGLRLINVLKMAGKQGDPELQEFLAVEQQKAMFQNQIHRLTDMCWDLCVDKPKDKLDGRTEGCLGNCVERFLDTTHLITGRFQQLLQKGMGQ